MNHAVKLLSCLSMVVLAGCASMGPVEPPDVTLVNLEVTEVTPFETTLEAEVRIINPNPDPLAVEGASFKLELLDHKIGTGTSSATATVPALDSATVPVTFRLNNVAAVSRLRTVLEAEALDWRLRGTVFARNASGGRMSLEVEESGRLSFDDMTTSGRSTAP
jgi:LEA14-like dessication related protein